MSTEQRIAVMQAIDAFCDMATKHPNTPHHEYENGSSYTHGYRPDQPGQKFTRIIMTSVCTGSDGNVDTKDQSVHAFVDNITGDLYKAASWKVPAKGARYNLLTEMDVVEANFVWTGGYLYADWKRR